jgi:mannose-1-phosphate guanylyltransferase
MLDDGPAWAVVLAGGDGMRLHDLTTLPSGEPVPKQFCTLRRGLSLLEETLLRARTLTNTAHVCAVVADQHRHWWESYLSPLPPQNVFVQPTNRGTGTGILLALQHIAERDPAARVVILPADHSVHNELVLTRALQRGLELLRQDGEQTMLVGIEPEESSPDFRYILPLGDQRDGLPVVGQFVEQPPLLQAHELIARGASWNSFIMISTARPLLRLFNRRLGEAVTRMRLAIRIDMRARAGSPALTKLYSELPVVDCSRDILQGQEQWLRVLPVSQCGWSEVETPEAVAHALRRAPRHDSLADACSAASPLDLAVQIAHAGRAGSPMHTALA